MTKSTESPSEVVETLWDEKLSYSSFNTFNSCAKKYYHYKVINSPQDTDVEQDTFALRFGKAYHLLLEETMHDISALKMTRCHEVCAEYGLDEDDLAHLIAMLRNYQRIRNKTSLKAVKCEVQVTTPIYNGYIDVVFKDAESDAWWIGDLKTGASYDKFLNARLAYDPQLNLYAYHAKEVAALCGLNPAEFRGCRYLLTVKSRVKRKDGEALKDYMLRLDKAITSYEIPVYAEELHPEEIYEQFKISYAKVKAMHKAKGKTLLSLATPNFTNCNKYFKPCEYWSKCHGREFTKSCEREVYTSDPE